MKTGIVGNRAEKLATEYLRKAKLKLLERNYHCRWGEIDIVMQDTESLVFVEVRYRQSAQFGGALESIDFRKQQKLRRTAEHYLIDRKKTDVAARFDILCLSGELRSPQYQWIKNAF